MLRVVAARRCASPRHGAVRRCGLRRSAARRLRARRGTCRRRSTGRPPSRSGSCAGRRVVGVEAVERAPSPASAPGSRSSGADAPACSGACSGSVMMKALAHGRRGAMPSIRCRLTLVPMPKANTLALAEVLAHQLEGLVLDRDVAVGDDDHAARHVRRLRQRGDARAAPARSRCCRRRRSLPDRRQGAGRCWRGWPAPSAGDEHPVAAREQQHVEGVARAQRRRSGCSSSALRGVERIAVHRARDVDHEDVVARR